MSIEEFVSYDKAVTAVDEPATEKLSEAELKQKLSAACLSLQKFYVLRPNNTHSFVAIKKSVDKFIELIELAGLNVKPSDLQMFRLFNHMEKLTFLNCENIRAKNSRLLFYGRCITCFISAIKYLSIHPEQTFDPVRFFEDVLFRVENLKGEVFEPCCFLYLMCVPYTYDGVNEVRNTHRTNLELFGTEERRKLFEPLISRVCEIVEKRTAEKKDARKKVFEEEYPDLDEAAKRVPSKSSSRFHSGKSSKRIEPVVIFDDRYRHFVEPEYEVEEKPAEKVVEKVVEKPAGQKKKPQGVMQSFRKTFHC